MLIAFGKETGTGKTTMRYFVSALTDNMVIFYENMKTFFDEYNNQQLGQLWAVVDDIEKMTKKESDNLKGRLTSDTFRHRVMYMDPVERKCFLDLIATSNSSNPVFVDSFNRRTECIEINPEFRGDVKFWDTFYKELKDSDIMGAWFRFLTSRDISSVSFSAEYRFDNRVLDDQKKLSPLITTRFLMELFDDEWVTSRWCQSHFPDLYEHAEFKETVKHGKFLHIKTSMLFRIFDEWKKRAGCAGARKKRSDFSRELKEMGLEGRWVVRPGGKKGYSCRLSKESLEIAITKQLQLTERFRYKQFFIETTNWEILQGGYGF